MSRNQARNYAITLILTLTFLTLIPSFSTPASADVNIQFTSQNPYGQQFTIYQITPAGMIPIQTINVSDNVTFSDGKPLDTSSYVIMLKPSSIDFLHDPVALFNWIEASPGAVVAVLIGGGAVALFFVAFFAVITMIARRR